MLWAMAAYWIKGVPLECVSSDLFIPVTNKVNLTMFSYPACHTNPSWQFALCFLALCCLPGFLSWDGIWKPISDTGSHLVKQEQQRTGLHDYLVPWFSRGDQDSFNVRELFVGSRSIGLGAWVREPGDEMSNIVKGLRFSSNYLGVERIMERGE